MGRLRDRPIHWSRWCEWFEREAERYKKHAAPPFSIAFLHGIADLEEDGEPREDRIPGFLEVHLEPLDLIEIEFLASLVERESYEQESLANGPTPVTRLLDLLADWLNNTIHAERASLENSLSPEAMDKFERQYSRRRRDYWELADQIEAEWWQ
jgi:hypothetical protein